MNLCIKILTFLTFFYFAAKSGTIVLITNVKKKQKTKNNQKNQNKTKTMKKKPNKCHCRRDHLHPKLDRIVGWLTTT